VNKDIITTCTLRASLLLTCLADLTLRYTSDLSLFMHSSEFFFVFGLHILP